MIFCVEDDTAIRDIEVYALKTSGFEAQGFADGNTFWQALQTTTPELIVLDVMLPGVDGITLLRRLKANPEYSAIPVVMATARGAEYDKIQGLDLGADYYLTKPFGVMELISCIKAVLRRCKASQKKAALQSGPLKVNLTERSVTLNGNKLQLTYKEFELLKYLFENKGMVLTRDQILQHIWGYDFDGETRTVDVHVRTLRQKLGEAGNLIETVRGVGYRIGA